MPKEEPTDAPIFFVDRSLGRKVIPNALRSAGAKIIVHDDEFGIDTPDTIWLSEAGKHRWLVLTRDKRIRYRKLEKLQLKNAKVGTFVLSTRKNLTGSGMAECFVKALPKMVQFAEKTPRPFFAGVYASGDVRQLNL